MYGTFPRAHRGAAARRSRRPGSPSASAASTARSPRSITADGQRGAELLRQQLPRPRRPSRPASTRPKSALDDWGYGMASVRFICGTQEQHLELERRVSAFLGTEATILFSSCFDANGGVFETLFTRRGRDRLRRAEPRLHHRRHPPVEGAAVPLQEPRHGRPARRSSRPRGMPAPASRSSSPTASSRWTATSPRSRRSATSPTSSTPWSSSTTRTRSASSASTAGAPRSSAASPTGSTSTPGRSARRSAAPPAATSPAAQRDRRPAAPARAARTCSRTRSRRPSSPARSPRSTCWSSRTTSARSCVSNAELFRG